HRPRARREPRHRAHPRGRRRGVGRQQRQRRAPPALVGRLGSAQRRRRDRGPGRPAPPGRAAGGRPQGPAPRLRARRPGLPRRRPPQGGLHQRRRGQRLRASRPADDRPPRRPVRPRVPHRPPGRPRRRRPRGPPRRGAPRRAPQRTAAGPVRARAVVRAWHAAPMAATSPAPVTLVIGEEELLVDREVAAVVATVRAADPEAERHELIGGKVEPGEIAGLAAPSLFGGRSIIVVRSAQDLSKDVIAEIVAYAANPAEDAVLVLTHPGGAKGKALVDGLKKAKAAVVTVPKITKPAERLDFIKAEIKRAGRAIAPDAAQALLDAVGNDLRELAAACSQLVFDTPADHKTITAADVARYHRGQATVTGFAVAESAAEGKAAEALEQLRWSLATGTPPVLIVSALAKELRTL